MAKKKSVFMAKEAYCPPITFADLKRLTFCNSPKLTKVIIHGNLEEWVGIGFVTVRPATDEDRKIYPNVTD